ncbi:uncharacterized protein BDZ99DRAFT_467354 [Mytilinidion resinicola]|uniref:Uncharacterized protein n=1 Tax=Mytilinidion resinicola TaxID=574789 RepID=A0A6A6Y7K5_9PEZI|nr:uncharacterized protein BDZ99DRAFT_467354 [Mytilinidion resinicola]KAF2804670.1 hypothetical protein BDZ99DRAFT_467354 [Mytilinidion resinicola]
MTTSVTSLPPPSSFFPPKCLPPQTQLPIQSISPHRFSPSSPTPIPSPRTLAPKTQHPCTAF